MKNLKKIAIIIASTFLISSANAAEFGFNLGGSVTGGLFSVDGAKEVNADATKNANAEGDEAEGLFGLGSIFAEVTLDEKFVLGLDYVPHAVESNQVSNRQYNNISGTFLDNTAEVHIDEITTFYASYYFNENFYGKAGVMKADVITREVLGTGGVYPNAEIDGIVLGLGYEKDLNSGLFVRLEGSYIDLDGVTVVNTSETTKSVSVDGVTGYGAKLSVGKSF
jgi:hypothetical protein